MKALFLLVIALGELQRYVRGFLPNINVKPCSPDKDGHIRIPDKVSDSSDNGKYYFLFKTSIPSLTFQGCTGLKSIYIPDRITSIGEGAFEACDNLVEVQGAGKVTFLGSFAFSGCTSLPIISFPAGVQTLQTSTFLGATSLKTINFPDDSKLDAITLGAFEGCSSLETIIIPPLVTELPSLLFRTTKLNRISFADGSQLKKIGLLTFAGCADLVELSIPSLVTSMPQLAGLYKLENLTFAENSQLSEIGDGAFLGCIGLKHLEIPSQVKKIPPAAFAGLSNLESLTFADGSQVSEIGRRTFLGCTSLKHLEIPSQVRKIPPAAFVGLSYLESLTFADGSQVSEIGYGAFLGCVGLRHLEIPPQVTKIPNWAFIGLSNLESLIFADGSQVSEIGDGAFLGCTSLKHLEIPSQVEKIPSLAFAGMINLENVSYADGSRILTIGYGAFLGCVNLTSLTLPPKLTNVPAGAFAGLTRVKYVSIPPRITRISKSAFLGMRNLEEVFFAGESSLNSIGEGAFMYCLRLTTVNFPDRVTRIDDSAFSFTNLSSVHVPSSVEKIGLFAFSSCAELESVTFGDNSKLSHLDEGAFSRCAKLKKVHLPAKLTQLNKWILAFTYNLEEVVVGADEFKNTSSVKAVDDEFLEGSFLPPGGLYLSKGLRDFGTLRTIHGVRGLSESYDWTASASSDRTGTCAIGYGNEDNPLGATHFNCKACPAGKYKDNPSREPCDVCMPGKFQAYIGASVCEVSPAGTIVNKTEATWYEDCPKGKYSNKRSSTSCNTCPSGKYADQNGQSVCELCPDGKFMNQSIHGAIHSDQCTACAMEELSNANRTLCIVANITIFDTKNRTVYKNSTVYEDSTSESNSVWYEFLFSEDNTWPIVCSFITAFIFMLLGALTAYLREKDTERLANYSRSEALYNSSITGLSAGADFFSIFVIFTAHYNDSRGLAFGILMLLSRLIHPVSAGMFSYVMFSPLESVQKFEPYFAGLTSLRTLLHKEYVEENVWLVETISIFSFLDVSMVQFLPWKKSLSRFYVVSMGYPTLRVMNYCLKLKTLQACLTVFLESTYLLTMPSGTDEHTSNLLIMSIISCIIVALADVFILCVRGEVLKTIDNELKHEDILVEDKKHNDDDGDDENQKVLHGSAANISTSDHDDSRSKLSQSLVGKRPSSVGIEDLYVDDEEEDAHKEVSNPLNNMRLSVIEQNCLGDDIEEGEVSLGNAGTICDEHPPIDSSQAEL